MASKQVRVVQHGNYTLLQMVLLSLSIFLLDLYLSSHMCLSLSLFACLSLSHTFDVMSTQNICFISVSLSLCPRNVDVPLLPL